MTSRQRRRFERKVTRLRRAMCWIVSRSKRGVEDPASRDVGFRVTQALLSAAARR